MPPEKRLSGTDREGLRAAQGDTLHAAPMDEERVIDMPTTIALDELQKLIQQAAILVDVLPADEYTREHLPGAINIPLKDIGLSTAATLPRDRLIIVYCHDYE